MDEPIWIVNDLGELGVKLGDRCFFLYKGKNIEYPDGKHEDGTPRKYRRVGKREFGEICLPDIYRSKGYCKKGRYTEEVEYNPGLSFETPEDYKWKELPIEKISEITSEALLECGFEFEFNWDIGIEEAWLKRGLVIYKDENCWRIWDLVEADIEVEFFTMEELDIFFKACKRGSIYEKEFRKDKYTF